ncbi:hypothetical protein [Streptomyces sp. CB01635]|uniref:hypothetical protein n=1 Tax=unclassified Streptomyces TaxID=2593676 RepID=UPI001F425251|nr:hypothetical protein [Streptomyces sp. CB01635]
MAALRLGTTLEEAVAAAPREWGEAGVLRRSEDDAMAEEDGDVVTAIELWWPGEGRVSSTRVLLDGDEVFTTPARGASQQPQIDGGVPYRVLIVRTPQAGTRPTLNHAADLGRHA